VLTQDPADAERVVVPLEHAGAASPRTRRLPVAGRTLRLGLLVSVKSVARIEVTREPQQATVATIALRPARTLSPRSCGQPAPRWPVADRGRSQGGSCVRIPEGTPDPRSASSSESSMRLAIFSDVHGQVGRLSACLEAVARTGADELWCLGDAVDGLSARPPELTVACARAINDVCTVKLAGNHEAWALQDQSLPHAAAALIESWSVAAQRDGILAVHGSPHNPLMGRLSDERYVREALRRLPGWLCAHG
jgi:Calcineurin-like phosphoesterase superfamily domain